MDVRVILKIENVAVPKKWTFSKEEEFLRQLQIGNCESLKNAPFRKVNVSNGLSKKNTELRLVILTKF